ncbi:alpha/beta fold hydrolase [Nonomuraea wenchangensis]|uniref:alpha/beta fold hydrolase n=1 Tax=Nonomuraea wenchangensis TaxID=568860 RepID=UPI0033D6FB1B
MRTPDRPSAFTSDSARDKYHAVYDRLLAELWPVPVDAVDVETRAGIVRVHRAGPASVQRRPLTTGAEVGGWITDVLAAAGAERAHVAGFSAGGWAAVEQQRAGGGRVAALTLVDPGGFAPLPRRFIRWALAGAVASMLPRTLRHRMAGVVGNGVLREDGLVELMRAGWSFRRRVLIPPVYTDEQIREVSVPVQVLLGERSALLDARALAARLAGIAPSWRVEIVPGTGHSLPVEAPDLVAERILTFPRQTQGGTETPRHSTDNG